MKKLLSALLIATLLIASVACIFAVADEGDTAPIATIELHSGAIYASGSSVVLARIGENKTVEQITGYLRNGDAKDLNYFYAYVVVDGVVIEENETIGRPDGVKSDLEVPEGGYVVFISVVENETDMLKDTINVGTVVTLEGTTIEALSALEPEQDLVGAKAIFTEPTEEDNTSSDDENTSSDEENTSSDDENTSSDDENTSSDDENTSSSDDENTTSSEEENNTTSSEEAPAASSSESPETGDTGMIVFAVLAVVALAGGFVVIRARG